MKDSVVALGGPPTATEGIWVMCEPGTHLHYWSVIFFSIFLAAIAEYLSLGELQTTEVCAAHGLRSMRGPSGAGLYVSAFMEEKKGKKVQTCSLKSIVVRVHPCNQKSAHHMGSLGDSNQPQP